jgi:hypothetical protein
MSRFAGHLLQSCICAAPLFGWKQLETEEIRHLGVKKALADLPSVPSQA